MLTQLHGIKIEEKMCANCKHLRFSYSPLNSVSVQLQEKTLTPIDLEHMVYESFERKETQGYLCGKCGAKTKLITMDHIIEYPQLLFVYVNRFEWGLQPKKNQGLVKTQAPGYLNLAYLHFHEGCKSKRYNFYLLDRSRPDLGLYKLKGYIEHYGKLDQGHYVA